MGNSFLWVFTVSFLKILGKRQYGKEETTWVFESASLSSGSVIVLQEWAEQVTSPHHSGTAHSQYEYWGKGEMAHAKVPDAVFDCI